MTKPEQVAAELRDIAATLQAMIDGGAFDLCFEHVRVDLATLPDKLAALAADVSRVSRSVAALEELRPHWAQGHTSDSVAAQVTTVALGQLWRILGVTNQTEAVPAAAEAVAAAAKTKG